MSCEKAIFSKLRERGFRLTPQREMVLSVMHEMQSFATADEIFEGVRIRSAAVDISTVYRTLDLLTDFDVIAVIDLGDSQRRYKLAGTEGPQLHLVCRSCGQVIGLDQAQQQPLAALVQDHTGFEVDIGRLSVPGLCADCRVAQAAARCD
jgi:Fur family ferric uptake transcriptional regulator